MDKKMEHNKPLGHADEITADEKLKVGTDKDKSNARDEPYVDDKLIGDDLEIEEAQEGIIDQPAEGSNNENY